MERPTVDQASGTVASVHPGRLALAGSLHRSEVRRALSAALIHDAPTPETLEPVVPRYDSLPLLKRLQDAGELTAGRWMEPVRQAYRALVEAAPVPAPAATSATPTSTTLRALERLADPDRPREKALRIGITELDDAELVALLLRTGCGDEGVIELAQRILGEIGGLVGLARADATLLTSVRGVGDAKATELAAACELGRRLAAATLRDQPIIDSPEAVSALLGHDAVSLPHERLWCLPLDARTRLIGGPRIISQGDVDGTDMPTKAILRAALTAGASACVIAHNHPSGDPSPSAADLAATRRLVIATRTIDLPLLDHVVLGDGGKAVSVRRTNPHLWGA